MSHGPMRTKVSLIHPLMKKMIDSYEPERLALIVALAHGMTNWLPHFVESQGKSITMSICWMDLLTTENVIQD